MPERPAPSSKPVWQKLQLKPGQRALVLGAPAGYVETLPGSVAQQLDGTFDFIQAFATQRQDLLERGPAWRAALAPQGVLWVSYPKGKTVPTDLNRDVVRTTLASVGLEVVSQVAIDDVWSALRAKRIGP
jgi:hypothetical protein